TALLLYAAAPFARAADEDHAGPWSAFTAAYTWAASILVGLLIFYEVSAINVAILWTVLGLLLFEIGLQLDAGFLRWQGYAALLASFVRIFFVDLEASGLAGQINPRLFRVLPLAIAFYYVDWRLQRSGRGAPRLQRAGTVASYFGAATLAAL